MGSRAFWPLWSWRGCFLWFAGLCFSISLVLFNYKLCCDSVVYGSTRTPGRGPGSNPGRAIERCLAVVRPAHTRKFERCLAEALASRARDVVWCGVWLWLRPAHAHVIFRAVSGCGYVPRTCILYFIFYILSGVWLGLCPAHTCIMFSYGISIEISGNFQFLRGEEVVDSVRLGERQIKDYSPQ